MTPGSPRRSLSVKTRVDVNARVDYAHNDYLQLAAELGLPAALLFWALIFVLAARTLRACWIPGNHTRQAIALGATGALAALLLHSLTDFNLYIPANGLVFSVVLGLGSARRNNMKPQMNADKRR